MKFTHVLLVALVTVISALIVGFIMLPDNSGYFGLFMIGVSPVFVFVYVLWTYLLHHLTYKKREVQRFINQFVLNFLFGYLLIIFVSYLLSSDAYRYSFEDFKSDTIEILSDWKVLFCVIVTALVHGFLLHVRQAKLTEGNLIQEDQSPKL